MAPRRRKGGRTILSFFVNGEKSNDFEFFFSRGSEHLYLIADLAIENRAADGGRGGDHSLLDVASLAIDVFIFDFRLFLQLHHQNAGAVPRAVFRNIS